MTKEQFLAMSLPYGLKVYVKYSHNPDNSELETMIGLIDDSIITNRNEDDMAPLSVRDYGICLHPLSDLTKPITHKGETFVPIDWVEYKYYTLDLHKQAERLFEDDRWVNQSDFMLIIHLIEWHFDIAGLIEKGEAIDINTLNKNPYT